MISDIQRQPSQGANSLPQRAPVTAGTAPAAPAVKEAATKAMAKPLIQDNSAASAESLKRAIDQINTVMRDGGRGLNFVLDESLSMPIIKVTRAETGEVIRQIPNEVVVRVAHNLEKIQGLLFSSKA
jgi:flagellar protein FlaG